MGGDERSLGRHHSLALVAATRIPHADHTFRDVKPAPFGKPLDRGRSPHDWRPARFMVIVAHPDDADFGPAATAARWIDEGSAGWLVCCTSGDAGGEDPDRDPLELAAVARARAAGRRGSSATPA